MSTLRHIFTSTIPPVAAVSSLLLITSGSCGPSPRPHSVSKKTSQATTKSSICGERQTIGQAQALELAFKNYQQVFASLAHPGISKGEWSPISIPAKEDFEVSEGKYSWELIHDGPVGIVAHAKVDKCSGFVEWSMVGFAYE